MRRIDSLRSECGRFATCPGQPAGSAHIFAFANQYFDSASPPHTTGGYTLERYRLCVAQGHKTLKSCLLVDADPQGSLSLWQRLRGTGEPPIKTAVRSVTEIVNAAK